MLYRCQKMKLITQILSFIKFTVKIQVLKTFILDTLQISRKENIVTNKLVIQKNTLIIIWRYINASVITVGFHECHDHYEARKIEQNYFETLHATLNSIEPLPKPLLSSPFWLSFTPCKSKRTFNWCFSHNCRILSK